MTQNENEKSTIVTQRIRSFILGLSKEEKQIAVDTLPIELIYNRIGRELQEKAALEEEITAIQKSIEKRLREED